MSGYRAEVFAKERCWNSEERASNFTRQMETAFEEQVLSELGGLET